MVFSATGAPLARKLGIRVGSCVLLDGPPADLDLGPLPDDVRFPRRGPYDVIVCFCTDERRLRRRFPPLRQRLTVAGGLWVAWPKRSSGVPSDLSDEAVRTYGLSTGLVDVKVCAVDATWSALKFVVRVEDREQRG